MDWRVDALRLGLDPLLPGLAIEVVSETASTNTDLLERARSAGRAGIGPCLLIAERQSGGRGRLGRRWLSAPGASLTFSLALPLEAAPGLSLAVGVALADALEPPADAAGALRIGLKWPNDLWLTEPAVASDGRAPSPESNRKAAAKAAPRGTAALPGRKLGGILIETIAAGATRLTVIGVGLNIGPLDPAAAAAPSSSSAPELTNGYACLKELDAQADAPAVLQTVAPALLRALQMFERDGFGAFREPYAARDLLRGRAVTTTQPGASAGVVQGVADDGCLLLQTHGALLRIASGEVSVRAPGASAA